jgi:hypothetical protein
VKKHCPLAVAPHIFFVCYNKYIVAAVSPHAVTPQIKARKNEKMSACGYTANKKKHEQL